MLLHLDEELLTLNDAMKMNDSYALRLFHPEYLAEFID